MKFNFVTYRFSTGSRRIEAATFVALTTSVLLSSPTISVSARTRLSQLTYSTQAICEAAKVLSAEECRDAFVNANAELDEKAPRFGERRECEKYFHRCMIGDVGGSGLGGKARARVTFMPALVGVSISGPSSERRVLPMVEGREGEGLFQDRTVARKDTAESGAQTRRAQADWSQRLAAESALPLGAASPVYAPAPGEAESEPKGLDPACASLLDAFAYNECLARVGPKVLK